MKRTIAILLASLGVALAAPPQATMGTIPAGTIIRVRTNENIDSSNAAIGRVFMGVVEESAKDSRGMIVIPKGSPAELVVRTVSKHAVAVDLATVFAGNRTYAISSSQEIIQGTQKPGVGKNKRTAKFLGIGGAAGSVFGAIAGGGTGALIGGFVGAGGGAAAQTLTRGKSVNIPAESQLTFRLEQPLIAR
jgi:hypothetical protein